MLVASRVRAGNAKETDRLLKKRDALKYERHINDKKMRMLA
jgi:hypothetical protein